MLENLNVIASKLRVFSSKFALKSRLFEKCLVAVLPRYHGFCNSALLPLSPPAHPRPQLLLLLLLGPRGEDLKKLYQSLCHQPQGGRGQQDLPWEELEAMRRKTVVEETFLLELLFTSTGSATSCH